MSGTEAGLTSPGGLVLLKSGPQLFSGVLAEGEEKKSARLGASADQFQGAFNHHARLSRAGHRRDGDADVRGRPDHGEL